MTKKLHPLSQRKIIKIIENNGFRIARLHAHITFKKTAEDGKVLTTWVLHHKNVTLFVLKCIIRQTCKPLEEFY
ncbi:MAG: hypothetical protein DRN71_04330 [Candidatus Nanohalarchaeota archaeon]|nr:MAG: hypothetical protein DRN71_04330 [Candidatus Nanohaloarchaeota archaeon]